MYKNLYPKLCKEAKEYPTLSHYTNFESFTKIISNKSLLLNRLDKVSDLFEDTRVPSLHKNKIYVSCLTHRQDESMMFWEMYAKREKGLMITFPNVFNSFISEIFADEKCIGFNFDKIEMSEISHKSYDDIQDWGFFDITFADVLYTNDFSKYMHTDEKLKNIFKDVANIKPSNFTYDLLPGLVKHTAWNSEEETRLRVTLRPIGKENAKIKHIPSIPSPPAENIFLKLSHELLNEVKITINPWATEEFKIDVIKVLEDNKYSNYKIIDSALNGYIRS